RRRGRSHSGITDSGKCGRGWLILGWPCESTVVSSPLVALYGNDVILSCTFPPKPNSGKQHVTINWERNNPSGLGRVIHSYYYQRDQLDLQDEAYRNRTQIFPEEVRKGNASLKLMRVRPEDEGSYTCYVGNEQDHVEHSTDLVVSAPYKEPRLTFDLSSHTARVLLIFTTSGGYPAATVRWQNETGSDITDKSNTTQSTDRKGLFEIRSEMVVSAAGIVNYTFVLDHGVLQQRITRPVSVASTPPPTMCVSAAVVSSPLVALYGDDVILSCTFPHKPDSGTQHVLINWERNNPGSPSRVIHHYYYQQDQLVRQDEAYRNRTQIFPEEVRKGNASLKLMRVRPGDEGRYTCSVGNEQDHFEHSVDLVVAAPYEEPRLTFDLSSHTARVLLIFTTSGGYPAAAVWWQNETGSDITGESTTTQSTDRKGLFEIRSEMVVSAVGIVNYTFVLDHGALQQRITWPVSVVSSGSSTPPPPSWNRLNLTVCVCLFMCVYMCLCWNSAAQT
uniref:Ig-like domain-containing protein n=1 Tax=Latimeria chalumnae TaxID=7897 RepID=H2ZZ52_LATCH